MANITLEITVLDEHIEKIVEAFTYIAGNTVTINMDRGHGVDCPWSFVIQPKSREENLKQFGERFLRELGKAVIKMYDYSEDYERYRTDISNITLPSQDIPEDILE